MIRVLILILVMTFAGCVTIGQKSPIMDRNTWERDLDRQNGF